MLKNKLLMRRLGFREPRDWIHFVFPLVGFIYFVCCFIYKPGDMRLFLIGAAIMFVYFIVFLIIPPRKPPETK